MTCVHRTSRTPMPCTGVKQLSASYSLADHYFPFRIHSSNTSTELETRYSTSRMSYSLLELASMMQPFCLGKGKRGVLRSMGRGTLLQCQGLSRVSHVLSLPRSRSFSSSPSPSPTPSPHKAPVKTKGEPALPVGKG